VTDSTIEVEYIVKKGAWMRMFLIDLGVFLNVSSPLNLNCDNYEMIALAKDHRNH